MTAVWHSSEEDDSGHKSGRRYVESRRGRDINKKADCDEGIELTTL